MKTHRLYPRIAALLSAMLLLSISLRAQDSTCKGSGIYGGFGHFNFSAEQVHVAALNTALAANGYDQLNTTTGSFGGGGSFSFNNLLLGGGGAWLMNAQAGNADKEVTLKGGYGYFSCGYILFAGKRSIFYPTLSVGGGGYSLIISQPNGEDFSQQLNAPNGMVTAEAGGWITGLQLNYQHFFSKHGRNGFFLGVKAGYKYVPGDWKLSINNSRLNGSPKINMNGFHLTLMLGGGFLSN